jgi:hypothetical protein
MHLITGPAPHRPQTRPPRKTQGARRPSGHGARLVGRGRRLMHLLGAGPVVPGEKGKSAKSRNNPIRGSAARRRPSGGAMLANVWMAGRGSPSAVTRPPVSGEKRESAKSRNDPIRGSAAKRRPSGGTIRAGSVHGGSGVASAVTRPLVPGEQRESAIPRNDPIRGSAAKRRPSRGAMRAGSVDAASRGCPRPSPDRGCPARSANRRNRATTLYAVLPPSAAHD